MISAKLVSSKPAPADQSVGTVLEKVHKVWVEQTRRFVEPATDPEAPFWTRWSAVRYLADQFLGQYRRERALVDELRPFLAPAREPAPSRSDSARRRARDLRPAARMMSVGAAGEMAAAGFAARRK